jgi:drug/metabolite transporter (DMT)-like permease
VFQQLTPVTALALGVVVYGDPLRGTALAGSALTIAAVAWAAWSAHAEPSSA